MTYDYLILGGGLAGTILGDFLSKEAGVLVLDQEAGENGSKVAAGIYNPVTGRRMVKSWMVDTLAPFARSYYTENENALGKSFLRPINIKRLFHNQQQRDEWLKKVDFYGIEHIIDGEITPDAHDKRVVRDYGGVATKTSWRLDTRVFLEAMHEKMQKAGTLVRKHVAYKDITIQDDGVQLGEFSAKKLIFCEGWYMANNPWFQHLTLVPNKGELLTIRAEELEESELLQKGMFVLPLGDGCYKVGATYNKEKVDYHPTEGAKDWLLERLERTIKVPYEILKHEAGVRPTSKDRRPLLGIHHELPELAVFNGFGSKGVSQMPWCAQQMTAHLQQGEALFPEVDIQRFSETTD